MVVVIARVVKSRSQQHLLLETDETKATPGTEKRNVTLTQVLPHDRSDATEANKTVDARFIPQKGVLGRRVSAIRIEHEFHAVNW